MRAVIQKVSCASVVVDGETVSSIKNGLLVLVGIEDSDTLEDIEWLSRKIVQLRIFPDAGGVQKPDKDGRNRVQTRDLLGLDGGEHAVHVEAFLQHQGPAAV